MRAYYERRGMTAVMTTMRKRGSPINQVRAEGGHKGLDADELRLIRLSCLVNAESGCGASIAQEDLINDSGVDRPCRADGDVYTVRL
jgi:hypothetical protein